MRITLVKTDKEGEFNLYVKPTRRGEEKTAPIVGVPKDLVGEAVDEQVRKTRRQVGQEPTEPL